MTRTELLQHLISQARERGFEFRKWFRAHTARPWTTPADAVDWLAQGSRAHMLIFSHTFARAFFREGERIRFIQPALAYQRIQPDGSIRTVQRPAHTRQSAREDVWRYHLREMAAADEPLRYIRRYLLLEETLREAQQAASQGALRPGTPSAPTIPEPFSDSPDSSPNLDPDPFEADIPANYDDELLVRD